MVSIIETSGTCKIFRKRNKILNTFNKTFRVRNKMFQKCNKKLVPKRQKNSTVETTNDILCLTNRLLVYKK